MHPLRHVLAVTVTTLLAVAGVLAPTPASAETSTLALNTYERPDRPHFVPTGDSWEGINWRLEVTEDATDVTIHAEGEGLSFADDTDSYAEVHPGDGVSGYFEVTATSPGFHSLTITATAAGAEPVSVTLPLLWAPGGPPLPGGGDLSGRGYGWSGYVSGVVGESSSRVTTMLTFVDDTYAFVGKPGRGLPTCPGRGCVRYHYDPSTGLVQVGHDLIGQVLGPRLYVEGLTYEDPELADFWPAAVLSDAVGTPRHQRYSGTWSYSSRFYPDGLVEQRLTLNRNGTFRLRFRYDFNPQRKLSGTYHLGRSGGITFRSPRTDTILNGTLLVREDLSGVPKPGTRGIWLILALHRDGDVVVDGNRMRPA